MSTRTPSRALLTVGSLLVAGLAWAMSSPVGSSPDEDYHLTSIWCPPPVDDSGCRPGTDAQGVAGVVVPELVAHPQCFAGRPTVGAACQEGMAGHEVISTRVDRGDYPPFFYRVMHVFVGPDVATSVLVIRAVNLLLAVLLIGTACALGTPAQRRHIGVATLVTVVPLGCFVVPSVNPSSWAVTGVATAACGVFGLATATGRRAWAWAALALVGMALASAARGDAGVFVVIVSLAVAVLTGWRSWARPDRAAVLLLAVLIGGASAWSARQLGGFAQTAAPQAADQVSTVVTSMVLSLPDLVFGSAGLGGGLGWMDTRMPSATIAGALTGLLGVLVLGLGQLTRRKSLALSVLVGAFVGIPIVTMFRNGFAVGESLQPRYLLPLVFPIVLAALVAGDNVAMELTRTQARAIALAVTGANSAALFTNLRRYTTGLLDSDVAAIVRRWWWPTGPAPGAVWVLGSIAFALGAWVWASPPVRKAGDAGRASASAVRGILPDPSEQVVGNDG